VIRARRLGVVMGVLLLPSLAAGVLTAQDSPARLATTRQRPEAFGTDAYTVTTISATGFTPGTSGDGYATSGTLARWSDLNSVREYYAPLDLPAGAIIDYVGLNSSTDSDFALGVSLYHRSLSGSTQILSTFSSAAHDWSTDFNQVPIGYIWHGASGEALILNVEQGSFPNPEYFGWVEVWWKRSVSPPPGSASFNDVPTNHPFYTFIEALYASGITGGCGAGNYCPDSPVTRGQMAVFLAKALGLHWPAD
jgi:hypothetical protein